MEKTDMIESCLIGLSVLFFYAWFVEYCEHRTNLVEINDPLFDYLPIYDTSIPIGIILWVQTIFFFMNWSLWDQERAIWCFVILMISRSFVLYFHPFQGHHTMEPLRDVIIEWITGTQSEPFVSDNSFSGHCSTLFALGLLLDRYKTIYFALTLITACLLIISRVHYTADCIIAPIFSYWAYNMAPHLMTFWKESVPPIITFIVCIIFLWNSALPELIAKKWYKQGNEACVQPTCVTPTGFEYFTNENK
jgi:hypothetical protein